MTFDKMIASVEFLKLFIPGPTYVSRELMSAATIMPNFGHRDDEMVKRFKSIYANMRKIAEIDETYNIILMPGSGSNAIDASIASLVGDDEKVLSVSCGGFGELSYNFAVANRKNAEKISFPWGKGIDLNVLESKLKEMKSNGESPSVVTFVHNETSTGVMVDVAEISKVIKRYGAMPIVDGVSVFGCAQTGIGNTVAIYCAATQKGLALDAGFGIALVSEEALERAKYLKTNNKCYPSSVLDISKHSESAKNFMTYSTPNCTLINAMYLQMDYIVNVEGVEERYNRHKEMKKITHQWIDHLGNGFRLFSDKECSSNSLTVLQTPNTMKTKDLNLMKEEMRKEGYLIGLGMPNMNKVLESRGEGVTIRITHMGDITINMLTEYLDLLEKHLCKLC